MVKIIHRFYYGFSASEMIGDVKICTGLITFVRSASPSRNACEMNELEGLSEQTYQLSVIHRWR